MFELLVLVVVAMLPRAVADAAQIKEEIERMKKDSGKQ
jgi:hypothetical protein